MTSLIGVDASPIDILSTPRKKKALRKNEAPFFSSDAIEALGFDWLRNERFLFARTNAHSVERAVNKEEAGR